MQAFEHYNIFILWMNGRKTDALAK